jgi:hypothetical protein
MTRGDAGIGGASLADVGGDGAVKDSGDIGAAALTPNYSVCDPSCMHWPSMNTRANSLAAQGETAANRLPSPRDHVHPDRLAALKENLSV